MVAKYTKLKVFHLLNIIISSVGFLRSYQLHRPISSSRGLFKFNFNWNEPTMEELVQRYHHLQDDKDFQFMIGTISKEINKNLKWNEKEYLAALIKNDVYRTDNYWETVFPKYERRKKAALAEGNVKKAEEIENNFWELQQLGFKRRLIYENSKFDYSDPNQIIENLNGFTHSMANSLEDLDKTPDQLVAEFKERQSNERFGLTKLLPSSLVPLYDYLVSLVKYPSFMELFKSLGAGAVLSMIAHNSKGPRFLVVAFVGILISGSLLLSRNMPPSDSASPFSISRDIFSNCSAASIRTAFALTLSFFLTSTILCSTYLSVARAIQFSVSQRILNSVIFGMMTTAIANSFFEIYEEKSRSGWRWSKAVNGYTKEEIEKLIYEKQHSDLDGYGEYDFEYDPDSEEVELESIRKEEERRPSANEIQANKHYEEWQKQVEHARQPCKEEFTTADYPLIGVKEGFFDGVESFDPELVQTYMDTVGQSTAWRTVERADPRGMKKLVKGPKYFREPVPKWYKNLFMEPSAQANMDKLKRKYGAYRKSMWRKDDQVVLLPCDGVRPDEVDELVEERSGGASELTNNQMETESEINDVENGEEDIEFDQDDYETVGDELTEE